MAYKRKRVEVRLTELQMTSMIDMVFLLNSFFLIVNEYSKIDAIAEINLPPVLAARPDENPDPNRLVINIDKDGHYIIGGERRSTQWVRDALATEARLHRDPKTGICDRPVLVRADERAEFKAARELITLCVDKHIKIWRMAFATYPGSPADLRAMLKERP